mgnify:CR=1 FL=1
MVEIRHDEQSTCSKASFFAVPFVCSGLVGSVYARQIADNNMASLPQLDMSSPEVQAVLKFANSMLAARLTGDGSTAEAVAGLPTGSKPNPSPTQAMPAQCTDDEMVEAAALAAKEAYDESLKRYEKAQALMATLAEEKVQRKAAAEAQRIREAEDAKKKKEEELAAAAAAKKKEEEESVEVIEPTVPVEKERSVKLFKIAAFPIDTDKSVLEIFARVRPITSKGPANCAVPPDADVVTKTAEPSGPPPPKTTLGLIFFVWGVLAVHVLADFF